MLFFIKSDFYIKTSSSLDIGFMNPPKRSLIKSILNLKIVKVSLKLILCGKAGIG